jgi:sec-independent protein translocase protein TatA
MNLASLFDLDGTDLIVILIIVLLLFGARNLPNLFHGFGEALQEFRKALNEAADSQDESEHHPKPTNPFNIFASALVFVAFTVFLLALAGRYSH